MGEESLGDPLPSYLILVRMVLMMLMKQGKMRGHGGIQGLAGWTNA